MDYWITNVVATTYIYYTYLILDCFSKVLLGIFKFSPASVHKLDGRFLPQLSLHIVSISKVTLL